LQNTLTHELVKQIKTFTKQLKTLTKLYKTLTNIVQFFYKTTKLGKLYEKTTGIGRYIFDPHGLAFGTGLHPEPLGINFRPLENREPL
jgi:hypothetical protein